MGNATRVSRSALWGVLALYAALDASACAQADAVTVRFDIPGQPAAPALNEFARQADIALIFSYDLVADVRTRPLEGRFTVDDGLARLLQGTVLDHRQADKNTYLICPLGSCERDETR